MLYTHGVVGVEYEKGSHTAFALCRDNEMPIIVFNMTTPNNIAAVLANEAVHTRVVRDTDKTEYA